MAYPDAPDSVDLFPGGTPRAARAVAVTVRSPRSGGPRTPGGMHIRIPSNLIRRALSTLRIPCTAGVTGTQTVSVLPFLKTMALGLT